MPMNHYGTEAKAYFQRWLPSRYKALPDPEQYFTALGEQIEQQVGDLWDDLVRRDQAPEGESHHERAGRLQLLKEEAARAVKDDLVHLPPEEGTTPDPDDGLESDASFQARTDEFQQHLEWRSRTVEQLLDQQISVDDLTDAQLRDVIEWMTPAFLALLGTSVDAERTKGRAL